MAKTGVPDENQAYQEWKNARFDKHFFDESKRLAHLRQADFLSGGRFDPQLVNRTLEEGLAYLVPLKRVSLPDLAIPQKPQAAKGWLSFFGRKDGHAEKAAPQPPSKPRGPNKP